MPDHPYAINLTQQSKTQGHVENHKITHISTYCNLLADY
jgi:hypothetical protein